MDTKKKRQTARIAPVKRIPPPSSVESLAAVKEKLFNEFKENQAMEQRWGALRERSPQLFARLNLIETLITLQSASGGTFTPGTVFVHMPDNVLNIKAVGNVNVDALTVALQVYDHDEIAAGIIWVPIDHLLWVGSTDKPLGAGQAGLRRNGPSTPATDAYQHARMELAGLKKAK